MRNFILVALQCVMTICAGAQVSGQFIVYGDINTYYAVSFTDGGWDNNIATEMTSGRSNVHTDATWRGSVIAKVSFHVTNWGHVFNLISVDMSESTGDPALVKNFIGGWVDGTIQNGSSYTLA